MEELIFKILSFTNTCFFIYGINPETQEKYVKHIPTQVDATNSAITVIDPTKEYPIERPTLEELMTKFDELGLTLDIEFSNFKWHRSDKLMQVFITHEQGTQLIMENPMLMGYLETVGIPVVHEVEGIYIYLDELYPEHKALFEHYNAKIRKVDENLQIIDL